MQTSIVPMERPERLDDYFCYVPIRKTDMDWGLYVTGAGSISMMPGYTAYPARSHPQVYEFDWQDGRTLAEYQVLYLPWGKGEFESASIGHVTIDGGSLFVLFPGEWHRYRPSQETGWDEYWISFAGDQMDRLVRQGFFAPDRAVLRIGRDETLLNLYRQILDGLRNEMPGFPRIIAAATFQILATAISLTPEEEPDRHASEGPREVATVDDRLVADALKLIWMQSEPNFNVNDLTRQLPTTRRSLERRFRAAVGHTILEEIIRCRLQRAQNLLRKTDLSITQVAATAGFSSIDNMGWAFRRFWGISPRAYRQKYRVTSESEP